MNSESYKPKERFPGPSGHHTGARICGEEGCREPTRENKPFCPQHVGSNPYAQKILAELEEAERKKAQSQKRVSPRCRSTAQKIMQRLKAKGGRSIGHLARELNMDHNVVWGHVTALAQKELVTITRNIRDTPIVKLESKA